MLKTDKHTAYTPQSKTNETHTHTHTHTHIHTHTHTHAHHWVLGSQEVHELIVCDADLPRGVHCALGSGCAQEVVAVQHLYVIKNKK
jgi:hypothetical protein